jgi:hypothetical protein
MTLASDPSTTLITEQLQLSPCDPVDGGARQRTGATVDGHESELEGAHWAAHETA